MAIKFNGTNQNIILYNNLYLIPVSTYANLSVNLNFEWDKTDYLSANYTSSDSAVYRVLLQGNTRDDTGTVIDDYSVNTTIFSNDSTHPLGTPVVLYCPNDYRFYANPAPLSLPNSNNPCTMCCWVKVANGYTTFSGIFSYGESRPTQLRSLAINNGKFVFTNTYNDRTSDITSIKSINDGNWHHIAMTYNGTLCKLYVDGVFDNQGNIILNTVPAGYLSYGSTLVSYSKLTGYISDGRIYNTVLSDANILAIYNGEYGVTQKHTILDTNENSNAYYLSIENRGNGWKLYTIFRSFELSHESSFDVISNLNYNITAVFNKLTGFLLYVNNALEDSYVREGFWATEFKSLYLGSDLNSINYFQGKIHNLRIYTKSLSTNDIQTLYFSNMLNIVTDNRKFDFNMIGEHNSVVTNVIDNRLNTFTTTINNSPTFYKSPVKLFKPKRINQIFVEGE